MGEFSAQWLGLREPVDHAARSASVLEAALNDLTQHHGTCLSGLRILDLGCGSGSNLRALAPYLGDHQHWLLVDYDDDLLDAASTALQAWAQAVKRSDKQGLVLEHAGHTISVTFQRADLVAQREALLARPVDLVTASALFDLVSADWVDAFVAQLKAPLYAVLSFDGEMTWWPEHPDDKRITAAFARHQQQEKGFGSALGPHAGAYLAQALSRVGWRVVSNKSPWQVADLPSAFHDMLIEGIASAVRELGEIPPEVIQAWLVDRRVAQRCVIGHDDLYASKR